ncbi:hypothetical protein TrCOL_g3621, partial [Triparma columacea]
MDKSLARKAPTGDILDDFRKAMSGVLEKVSHHDLAKIKAFADGEDTPRGLSILAISCLQELEERGKREAAEEEEASHGTERALTSVEAPGVRRGATQANNILGSLLKLGERMDADKAVAKSGFKEGEEAHSLDITLKEALVQTTWNIGAMLLISAVLCVVVAGLIYGFWSFLQGVSIRDAAVLQFGTNSTTEDYGREEFVDIYS